MIRLRVDEAAAIPLAVESASPVSMTVKEEFIDRGGASIQSNKTATPGAAAVVVTPDPGYDALAKVTVEAVPQGALSPIDIDFDDSTGAFTAEARVGTSGYIPDTAQVGGGFQLDTQAAATITPSTVQQQAVAAHKYTKGAVVVAPIPSEYIVPSGTKNIAANGNNQDVKAYEKVNVNVPNSYSASDEGKVVSNGALVSQSSQTINENGTYDTTLKNEVVVDVQSGGGDPNENLIKANNNTLASFSDPNLTYIRAYMFYGCSSLKSIDLPSLIGIQDAGFRGCDLTGNISFGNFLEYFMNNALRANTHMTSVTFKKGIVRVDTSIFEGCSNLTVIDIGDWGSKRILNINGAGFYNTPNIAALIIRGGSVFPLANSLPTNSALSSTTTIYVPQSLVATYQGATNWSTYASRIVKIEGSQYENYYADGSPVT